MRDGLALEIVPAIAEIKKQVSLSFVILKSICVFSKSIFYFPFFLLRAWCAILLISDLLGIAGFFLAFAAIRSIWSCGKRPSSKAFFVPVIPAATFPRQC
jgi:hypothetical protein